MTEANILLRGPPSYGLDFDPGIPRKINVPHDGTGRERILESFLVQVVEIRVVIEIHQENTSFHDGVYRAPSRPDHGQDVLKTLLKFSLDGCLNEFSGSGIETNLTGSFNTTLLHNPLTVGTNGLRDLLRANKVHQM